MRARHVGPHFLDEAVPGFSSNPFLCFIIFPPFLARGPVLYAEDNVEELD